MARQFFCVRANKSISNIAMDSVCQQSKRKAESELVAPAGTKAKPEQKTDLAWTKTHQEGHVDLEAILDKTEGIDVS